MAKAKKTPAAAKKSSKKERMQAAPALGRKDSGLNVMVQIYEPKNLRKNILEALREIIIFMQGYEAFRRIQEEKVKTFTQLREDVRGLNSLSDNKLRRYLPKGKLTAAMRKPLPKKEAPEEREPERPRPRDMPIVSVPKAEPERKEPSDLDELEQQLRDIESRLKGM